MKVYLFDTNVWSRWFRKETSVVQKIACLDNNSIILLSAIVWGEAIHGAKANKKFDFQSYKSFIHQRSDAMILSVDKHVAEVYGELKAALFDKYLGKGKHTHPEQLIDPATATEIGIDENDLWLVAQAITHDLILITHDKMNRIFTITPKELKYEIWP